MFIVRLKRQGRGAMTNREAGLAYKVENEGYATAGGYDCGARRPCDKKRGGGGVGCA